MNLTVRNSAPGFRVVDVRDRCILYVPDPWWAIIRLSATSEACPVAAERASDGLAVAAAVEPFPGNRSASANHSGCDETHEVDRQAVPVTQQPVHRAGRGRCQGRADCSYKTGVLDCAATMVAIEEDKSSSDLHILQSDSSNLVDAAHHFCPQHRLRKPAAPAPVRRNFVKTRGWTYQEHALPWQLT